MYELEKRINGGYRITINGRTVVTIANPAIAEVFVGVLNRERRFSQEELNQKQNDDYHNDYISAEDYKKESSEIYS